MLRCDVILMTVATAAAAATAAVVTLLLLAVAPRGLDQPDPASAQRAALHWTGGGQSEAPRRNDEAWEVDVRRADGSLVEIQLGPELELWEVDEELSTGGAPAHDEATGAVRARAITAARTVFSHGSVRSVERERDGSFEVDIVDRGQTIVEIELDRQLRVTDTDNEAIGDE